MCLEGQIYNYDDCTCDGEPDSSSKGLFFLKTSPSCEIILSATPETTTPESTTTESMLELLTF